MWRALFRHLLLRLLISCPISRECIRYIVERISIKTYTTRQHLRVIECENVKIYRVRWSTSVSKLPTIWHTMWHASKSSIYFQTSLILAKFNLVTRNPLRRKKAGLNFRSGTRLLSVAHSTQAKRDYGQQRRRWDDVRITQYSIKSRKFDSKNSFMKRKIELMISR